MTIDILLSTYNSESYLEDLLKSLFLQSNKNWRLLIRDDCSTDNTLAILNSYKKSDPKRFYIIENEGINLGPKKSFEKLLENSNADYMLFCDQDDYWMENKIEDSIKKMKQIEHKTPDKAALLFTDLSIADQHLNIIQKSFWSYSKINPANVHNIYKLMINNPVVGCTIMMNKKAKFLILPMPDQAIMHDWWAALKIVSEGGAVDYLNKPTILYRQHDKNKIGAENITTTYFIKRFVNLSKTIKNNMAAFKMFKQLDLHISFSKLFVYKVIISFTKIFK